MLDFRAHVLLTGGTGFFGLALLRQLKTWEGPAPRVTVLSRNPQAFQSSHPELAGQVQWVRGDVLDRASLPHGQDFSHILHAATDSTVGPRLSPLARYTQIVDGTRNILELAVSTGASRFLLTSSGGVYGPQGPGLEKIPENHHALPDPLNPANAYSVAKRAAEHLCALYQAEHGLQAVVARCFAFIGQDLPLNVHFAVGNFIRDALEGEQITVASDGRAVRSYMDQRDLARWLWVLMERGGAGQAYNVGSDVPITIGDLAHRVRDMLAPSKAVSILGSSAANSARNFYVPSIEKARLELGLDLRHTLEDALAHFRPN